MNELRWWRIETTDAGKVLSCTPVETGSKDGRLWFYVEARDEKEAGRLAFNRYCKVRQEGHRLRNRANGKCEWCGRAANRGSGKRCTVCLEKDQEYKDRQSKKAAGKPFVPADRAGSRAARDEEKRALTVASAAPSLRLDVLLEVQEAWQNASTNGLFTRWLNEKIATAAASRERRDVPPLRPAVPGGRSAVAC